MGSINLNTSIVADRLFRESVNSGTNGVADKSFGSAQSSGDAKQADSAASSSSSSSQDTVTLSMEASVTLLYNQGQSVDAIASSLGTTTSTVNQYLGLSAQSTSAIVPQG